MEMTAVAKTIEQRYQAATVSSSRRPDVQAVLDEIVGMMATVTAQETVARERSLDLGSSVAEARKARDEAAELAFTRQRLAAMEARLESRLQEISTREAVRALDTQYVETAAANEALVHDIRQTWLRLIAELTDLFERMEANGAAIEEANRNLPPGREKLVSAELQARGLRAWWWPPANNEQVTSLTRLKLPHLDRPGLAWPIDRDAAFRQKIAEQEHARHVAAAQARRPEAIAARRAAEEAQWSPYRLFHQRGEMILSIQHRHGVSGVDTARPLLLWMNPDQAERARAKGITVEQVSLPAELDAVV